MKIEEIDKNFKVTNSCGRDDVVFIDCLQKPIKVYGLIAPNENCDHFIRIPEEIARATNEGVKQLNSHTAGGRVRLKTNSPYIAIKADMHEIGKMPHFALTGSAGFDLYKKENGEDRYMSTFFPPFDITNGFEGLLWLGGEDEHEVTVNFPLYSGIKSLKIGLKEGSTLNEASDYDIEKPIVYYGSSITQGGCASRPGNSYQAIVSRKLNCNHINLGFSGSAKAEEVIGEYMSELDMSVFVLDYDHNAPTTEHLRNTHERIFNQIRSKNPELPIIMMSRPQPRPSEDDKLRKEIIIDTYNKAIKNGDKNVYFIDGEEMLKIFGGDSGTVDNCHPNDLGFMCMAESILPCLKEIFKK